MGGQDSQMDTSTEEATRAGQPIHTDADAGQLTGQDARDLAVEAVEGVTPETIGNA
jgi:hypothetical protein